MLEISGDTEKTIFERIGGQEGVDEIIDEFYKRIVSDSVLESYFTHLNMDKIMSMQRHFITAATGGPMVYSGRPLSQVHKPLGISRFEFDRYIRLLIETLEFLGISEEDSRQVVASISIYADDITNDVS